jgi:hypothetical protein
MTCNFTKKEPKTYIRKAIESVSTAQYSLAPHLGQQLRRRGRTTWDGVAGSRQDEAEEGPPQRHIGWRLKGNLHMAEEGHSTDKMSTGKTVDVINVPSL